MAMRLTGHMHDMDNNHSNDDIQSGDESHAGLL